MTVSETAEWLKVRPSWVYANADELGAVRLGKYLRFLPEVVLQRLQESSRSTKFVGSPAQRPRLTDLQSRNSKE
jgi:hypothetical protein